MWENRIVFIHWSVWLNLCFSGRSRRPLEEAVVSSHMLLSSLCGHHGAFLLGHNQWSQLERSVRPGCVMVLHHDRISNFDIRWFYVHLAVRVTFHLLFLDGISTSHVVIVRSVRDLRQFRPKISAEECSCWRNSCGAMRCNSVVQTKLVHFLLEGWCHGSFDGLLGCPHETFSLCICTKPHRGDLSVPGTTVGAMLSKVMAVERRTIVCFQCLAKAKFCKDCQVAGSRGMSTTG